MEKNGGGNFSRGKMSWEDGGTYSKIVVNLPRTYDNVHIKVEAYRFSGYMDS